ncbi:MAG: hypothetical protein ACKVQU_23015 [Burkholderiales bacterium]
MAEHVTSAAVMMQATATALLIIITIMGSGSVIERHIALVVRTLTKRRLPAERWREHRRQQNSEQETGDFSSGAVHRQILSE